MYGIKPLYTLLILFPLMVCSQNVTNQYQLVTSFVVDSVIKNRIDEYFISNIVETETEFVDFHGISESCEIQHRIFYEILTNGKKSEVGYDLQDIMLTFEKSSKNKFKIKYSTIVQYGDIWLTYITVHNTQKTDNEWDKYLLVYIDNQLIYSEHQKWHGD